MYLNEQIEMGTQGQMIWAFPLNSILNTSWA